MRAIRLGPLFGLRTTLLPLFWPSYALLALLAAFLAHTTTKLTFWPALLAGLLSALLFGVCEWLHQFGHALAARSVGYPMTGIRFFNLFSGGEYPADEPALPPQTHIRRALGGFGVNLVIGLLLLPVALWLWPHGREILPPAIGVVAWLAGFGLVANLVVLGLGALLPLKIPGGGLNDGGTLLKFWLERRSNPK